MCFLTDEKLKKSSRKLENHLTVEIVAYFYTGTIDQISIVTLSIQMRSSYSDFNKKIICNAFLYKFQHVLLLFVFYYKSLEWMKMLRYTYVMDPNCDITWTSHSLYPFKTKRLKCKGNRSFWLVKCKLCTKKKKHTKPHKSTCVNSR